MCVYMRVIAFSLHVHRCPPCCSLYACMCVCMYIQLTCVLVCFRDIYIHLKKSRVLVSRCRANYFAFTKFDHSTRFIGGVSHRQT